MKEQDIEIISKKLMKKMHYLQSVYLSHEISDKHREIIKKEIDIVRRHIHTYKELLKRNIHYIGDINTMICSKL
jgi:hypothetical protein